MKPIEIKFDQGIQFPPKLGTLILKRTGNGKLAYAQNVDSSNDEYGDGVITPGPALVTITNNSELTGVPFVKVFYGSSVFDTFLYFGQGLLGDKSVIRRVKNVVSGSTPIIDTGSVSVISAGGGLDGQTGISIVDMLGRADTSGDLQIYVVFKTTSAGAYIYTFNPNAGGNVTLSATNALNNNFTGGYTDQFMVLGQDNVIYWIGQSRVSSLDINGNFTVIALTEGLPLGSYASAGVEWNNFLAIAYSTDAFGDFERRNSAGRAGIVLWDYLNNHTTVDRKVPAPCRYISALVTDPSGNLLVFGGVDEGKSSIYEFTGYGFSLVTTYIGDLPRSRHSVEFDGQGRILWQTANGQFCRFNRSNGIFDHLGSMETSDSAGGLLAKSIGSPTGNEFLLASGSGTSYTMKRVVFGNYIGDDSVDGITSPLAVSGIEQVPYNTSISAITWHLSRTLQSGEKVLLYVYENGNPTGTLYSTLEYSVDGSVSSKREVKTLTNISNFSLGIKWQMADAQATAPGVLPAEVEWN